jgi:hypothetical protein
MNHQVKNDQTMLVMDNAILEHMVLTYRTLALEFEGSAKTAWIDVADEIEDWLNGRSKIPSN